MSLRQTSIETIKKYQHESGAYVASPNFPTYNYSWLRDGSFIAFGMDCVGEHQSAARFYRWVHNTLCKHQHKARKALEQHRKGQHVDPSDLLHTRYTVEGGEGEENWPNFQLDGYGTWLWGLASHIQATENIQLLVEFRESIDLTLDYIQEFWSLPNYDCWEEFGDRQHPATLACLFGGLQAISSLIADNRGLNLTAQKIRSHILEEFVYDQRVNKFCDRPSVDANLLWLTIPFDVFGPDDPIIQSTVREIETTLKYDGGGVHRYAEDTYYGGGLWVLLSAWLGWYYTQVGRDLEAQEILQWIENQQTREGELPEQVTNRMNSPEFYQPWVEKWGEIACPLLWSHAMYLVLNEKIRKGV